MEKPWSQQENFAMQRYLKAAIAKIAKLLGRTQQETVSYLLYNASTILSKLLEEAKLDKQ